ncbi:MAG: hypothetical protein JNL28_10785 [Planctomycetes bacterium]|nr:hypothetical protein [Planctomycetota bacterium]
MSTTPRRPFQDQRAPEPFTKAPEFKRMLVLFGLVALVGLAFAIFQYSQMEKAQLAEAEKTKTAARTLVPKEKLTPEQVEERRIALLSKFEGALADTENGQPLNYQQTSGFWKLLEILIRFSPEEVTQRTTLDFDWEKAMADPDGWRGEFVRARGIMSEMWAIKLGRPVLGRVDFYRSVLSDGENAFFIDLTERPPDLESDSRAVLEVEGVFYRTVKYEGRDGSQQTQPLLVVRNVRTLTAAAETGWRAWLGEHGIWVIAGMAILVFSAALLFSSFRRQRRRPRGTPPPGSSFQEMFEQKLRAEGKVPPGPQ